MKKIIVLLLSFMFFTSMTACSESPDKLYGYWKNERYKFMINENNFEFNKHLYPNITLTKKGELWTTNEIGKFLGASCSYSFKLIDDNTVETLENIGTEVKNIGKYTRITKQDYETEEIVQETELKEFPSLF